MAKEKKTDNKVEINENEELVLEKGSILWAIDMLIRGVNYASLQGIYADEDFDNLDEAVKIINKHYMNIK